MSETQAMLLQTMLTEENVQNLLDNIMITDESSAVPMNRLDVLYAVIKNPMTKPGKEIPVGKIFVPDGDKGCLYNFNDVLDGIVVSMFQEKNMFLSEEDAGPAHCGTVVIPPIMGRTGFRFGECRDCIHGKYVEGQISACLPVTKFLMLKVLDGELKLIQLKAKGVNQKPSKDAWVAFSGKVKGKTLSNLATFSVKEVSFRAKDGKDYDVYNWLIAPGGEVVLTPEQKLLLTRIKMAIQSYQLDKFKLLNDIVSSEDTMAIETHAAAPAVQHTAAPAIEHAAAPSNQAADLAIDAEITEPAAPAAAPAAEPAPVKKTLTRAASDISV